MLQIRPILGLRFIGIRNIPQIQPVEPLLLHLKPHYASRNAFFWSGSAINQRKLLHQMVPFLQTTNFPKILTEHNVLNVDLNFRRRRLNQFWKGQVRGAAFWRIGTNLRIFKQMLQDSGDNEWKYRLLLFLFLFIIINFLFNIMMAILTNIYLERLQATSSKFGFMINSVYKHGVVEEMITINDQKANENYLRCLRMLAQKNGLKNYDTEEDPKNKQKSEEDANYKYNIDNIIMSTDQLDKWCFERNDLDYISMYCDLALRYALTLPSKQSRLVEHTVDICFGIINHYEKVAHEEVGSYKLKNKALRTKADIMEYNNVNFDEIRTCLFNALELLEKHEFTSQNTKSIIKDVTEIPEDQTLGNNMLNSILDLCSFFTDSRRPNYINIALQMLTSTLRSLECELSVLDKKYDSEALFGRKQAVHSKDERRLMELKFEKIPLIQMEISEILWYGKHYNQAIDLARSSAQKSMLYSHGNYNCAKIARIGFKNLATMYSKEGDKETAELCKVQSEGIEIPLEAFSVPSRTVRDAVLEYWFGSWGEVMFPG